MHLPALADMRKLAGPSHMVSPVARLPAAPSADAFGDVCPVAGMIVDPKAKIMLNSGIAWWSDEQWEVGAHSPEGRMPWALLMCVGRLVSCRWIGCI
eukprot:1144295-Pelagomonas_calceolata.AAC.3